MGTGFTASPSSIALRPLLWPARLRPRRALLRFDPRQIPIRRRIRSPRPRRLFESVRARGCRSRSFFEFAPERVRRRGRLPLDGNDMALACKVLRQMSQPAVAERVWLFCHQHGFQTFHPGFEARLHMIIRKLIFGLIYVPLLSSCVMRASRSSISNAFCARSRTHWAARTRL
jgi:hypothetical protein